MGLESLSVNTILVNLEISKLNPENDFEILENLFPYTNELLAI